MMNRKYIVAAVAALSINGMVLAQMTGSDSKSPDASAPQPGSSATDRGANQLSDKDFVTQASSANHFEIQLSQLAASKLEDNQLKTMAKDMKKDHQQAQDKLDKIADKQDIKVASGITDPEQKMMLQSLKETSGADFQQAFLKTEAQAHQQTIDLFQRAQTQVPNQELKDYAQKVLPKLQEHMAMLKEHQNSARPAGSAMPGDDQPMKHDKDMKDQPMPDKGNMKDQPMPMPMPMPKDQPPDQPQPSR